MKKFFAASAMAAAVTFAASSASATTITIDWDGTPATETAQFTFSPGEAFKIFFGSYSGSGGDQTGFALFEGAQTATSLGTATLVTSEIAGSANCPTLGLTSGSCPVVNDSLAPGTVLYDNLTDGTYTLAIYDSLTPPSGSISFIAAVPLPAGGLLLMSALGLGVLARRRRDAQAAALPA